MNFLTCACDLPQKEHFRASTERIFIVLSVGERPAERAAN